MVERFDRDDQGYRGRINLHRSGHVLNVSRIHEGRDISWHRSSCKMIGADGTLPSNGKWWTVTWPKLCFETQEEVEEWLRDHGYAYPWWHGACDSPVQR